MQSNITPEGAIQALIHWTEQRGDAISLLLGGALNAHLPIKVSKTDVCAVLGKVVAGQLDLDELEMWANMLDARDEFDIEDIEGTIYALANAEQMGELTIAKVMSLYALLNEV